MDSSPAAEGSGAGIAVGIRSPTPREKLTRAGTAASPKGTHDLDESPDLDQGPAAPRCWALWGVTRAQ